MKSALWLNRTLIEIVFEKRNQAYGAFDLRLRYDQIMARAIMLSIGMFVTAWICFALWLNREKLAIANAVIELGTPVELLDAKPIKRPPVAPPPSAAPRQPIQPQTAFVIPTVVDNNSEVPEVIIPTQETLSKNAIGTTTIVQSGNSIGTSDLNTHQAEGEGEIITGEPSLPAQLFEVDQKPEFPGGDKELYKYLQDNLKYPALARENGLAGTVVVRFVVNAQGHVEQVEIVKSPSLIFNKEALAVIKGMPVWLPAKQKGRAVATYYVIPLKFQLL